MAKEHGEDHSFETTMELSYISFDPSNLSRSPGFSMKPSSFGNCKMISKAVLQVNLAWLNSLRERSQQVPRFAPKTHQQRHHSQRRFFLLNPCGDDVGLAQFFEPWKRRAIYAHALQAQQKGLVIHHGEHWDHIHPIYCYIRKNIFFGTNQMYCTNLNNLHPLKINGWNIIPWRFCSDHFPFLSWVMAAAVPFAVFRFQGVNGIARDVSNAVLCSCFSFLLIQDMYSYYI